MDLAGATPTRTCKDCGLYSWNLDLFVKSKVSKYGRRNLCISCAVKRNNNEPKQRDWKTNHQTQKRYGISADVYKQRMSAVSSCECCGSTEELCYDHDHKTMEFRGVLCRACNRSIGQLGDTVEGLERALSYLKRGK